MPFDSTIHTLINVFGRNSPHEDHWNGTWTSILNMIFPSSKGYLVKPYRFKNPYSDFRDLSLYVMKISENPFKMRTVLILQVRNNINWVEEERTEIETDMNDHTNAAERADTKVF